MSETGNAVHIIDDDESVRLAISGLMESEGIVSSIFASAEDFLVKVNRDAQGCVLADVKMPGMTGLELIEKMECESIYMPVVMMSGCGDISIAVKAMKEGVLDFIEKPFDNDKLIKIVRGCLLQCEDYREKALYREKSQKRIQSLTTRERQVMDLLVNGCQNKEIARELDISPRTVELHRAKIMNKLHASTISDVVRAGITSA
ncbi:response regulator transcription factor [Sulfuriflexus mobilis]|uniref:response regulator transcription factor n=1 Tax=Sulfuriflexus mobilis TaxID=1811807 RepID=UPI001558D638|nr:response regulator [Sulfuriflexus mobilis]